MDRRTRKIKVFIVATDKRPTPLEHFIYANDDLHKVVDKTGKYLPTGYQGTIN